MKLISYEKDGKQGYGIFTELGVIDLTAHLHEYYPDLKSLLNQPNFLEVLFPYGNKQPNISLSELHYLPVIPNPNKIFCIGMNYSAKRIEFDETNVAPTIFIRFPDSQTGHLDNIVKPTISNELDYEGELAVIIGKGGMNISEEQALEHVAGYSCYMDGSIRDWQHSWFTAGKNWPNTGAFGPYLVTTDEIPNPSGLFIHTYLNGEEMQNDNTDNLIHSVPQIIAYISQFSQLSAGDVIITGSPGGVGKKRTPPIFMHAGDIIEVEISKIGRLKNTIADE